MRGAARRVAPALLPRSGVAAWLLVGSVVKDLSRAKGVRGCCLGGNVFVCQSTAGADCETVFSHSDSSLSIGSFSYSGGFGLALFFAQNAYNCTIFIHDCHRQRHDER